MARLNKESLGELNQQEIELLYLIRNVYRYGEVTIQTRDGLPQDVIRTIVRVRLGDLSTEQIDTLGKQFTISTSS